jgi:hypothetical protein
MFGGLFQKIEVWISLGIRWDGEGAGALVGRHNFPRRDPCCLKAGDNFQPSGRVSVAIADTRKSLSL